jgi:hypothetical protein
MKRKYGKGVHEKWNPGKPINSKLLVNLEVRGYFGFVSTLKRPQATGL